jgi:uncharacterized protein YigA (DUF484 family)
VTAKQKTSKEPAGDPALSDERVRDYLMEHIDFFERHPDMLDQLQVSHSSGSAVSLVEKQVSVLRERNMEMRKRLNTLTSNARDNDHLYELTRKLILALMESGDVDELSETFLKGMLEDFQVEHASFILFGNPGPASGGCRVEAPESARIEIGALIKGGLPVCGTLRGEELRYLFPEAGQVGSAAVAPLIRGGELGVIAVGSDDPHRYGANVGTLFLDHIAEVLVRLLPKLDYTTPGEQ